MAQLFPKGVGDGAQGEAGPAGKDGQRGPSGASGVATISRFQVQAHDLADGGWVQATLTAISDPDAILHENELRPASGNYMVHFNLTVTQDDGGPELRSARIKLDDTEQVRDARSGIGADGTTPKAGTLVAVEAGQSITLEVSHGSAGDTLNLDGILSVYGG